MSFHPLHSGSRVRTFKTVFEVIVTVTVVSTGATGTACRSPYRRPCAWVSGRHALEQFLSTFKETQGSAVACNGSFLRRRATIVVEPRAVNQVADATMAVVVVGSPVVAVDGRRAVCLAGAEVNSVGGSRLRTLHPCGLCERSWVPG